jgi:hypothetical protein
MSYQPSKSELFALAKSFIPRSIPMKYELAGMMIYTICIEYCEYRVTYVKDKVDGYWFVYEVLHKDGSAVK